MRKIIFVISLIFSISSSAQMVDLIGGLSAQGAMDAAAYRSAAQGMSALNRFQMIQNLQQAAMGINIFLIFFMNFVKYFIPNKKIMTCCNKNFFVLLY